MEIMPVDPSYAESESNAVYCDDLIIAHGSMFAGRCNGVDGNELTIDHGSMLNVMNPDEFESISNVRDGNKTMFVSLREILLPGNQLCWIFWMNFSEQSLNQSKNGKTSTDRTYSS